jgi:hypothetical protein
LALSHFTDELLLAAVLVMLIASTFMAWNVRLALRRSIQVMTDMVAGNVFLTEEVWKLQERVEALESDAAKTND